jgi:cobalt-zinc-cadmium efflux system protein
MIPVKSDRHNEMPPEESKTKPLKLLWIVLCLRSGLFLAELITGLRVHSLSLIALSGHLLVDLIAIAIAIAAAWLVRSCPRPRRGGRDVRGCLEHLSRPSGLVLKDTASHIRSVEHSTQTKLSLNPQQIEALAAFLNSLILLAVAGSILWGILHNFQASVSEAGLPMLAIAALGLVVKGINASLLYEESHHSLNVRGVFFHAIADGVSSFGLLIAALAIFYLNWLWADTAASLLVVIFMLVSAFSLLKDSFHTINQ